jgi:hypothetical protein
MRRKTLEILMRLTEQYPNLRLGQILESACLSPGEAPLYYITDAELLERVRAYQRQVSTTCRGDAPNYAAPTLSRKVW